MLIGREKEIQELRQAYDSDESKFVAVFGRRRIGKTYLVREVFQDNFAFAYSGMAKASTKEQLQRFYLTLKDCGFKGGSYPNNWIEAFYMLEQYLKNLPDGKRLCSWMNCLGWMVLSQALCLLLRIFGMPGHPREKIYSLLYVDQQPLGW